MLVFQHSNHIHIRILNLLYFITFVLHFLFTFRALLGNYSFEDSKNPPDEKCYTHFFHFRWIILI